MWGFVDFRLYLMFGELIGFISEIGFEGVSEFDNASFQVDLNWVSLIAVIGSSLCEIMVSRMLGVDICLIKWFWALEREFYIIPNISLCWRILTS